MSDELLRRYYQNDTVNLLEENEEHQAAIEYIKSISYKDTSLTSHRPNFYLELRKSYITKDDVLELKRLFLKLRMYDLAALCREREKEL